MRFSVIIPCYNAAKWVQASLESVAQQTHAPHEIIVIDDGSTDDSVEKILSSGVEVKLLRTNRANGAGARNAGIEAATGDWIAFQDADDRWYADHLQRAARLLEGTKDSAYMGWCDLFTDEDENRVKQRPMPWPIDEATTGLTHRRFIEFSAQTQCFTMQACVIRRDVLMEIGGLDVTQVRRHDIDMWLRAIAGRTWTFNPAPTVAYRVDAPGGISTSVASAAYFMLRAIVKNRDAYAGPDMDRFLHMVARQAIATAFTDGDREDRRRARQLGWPYLTKAEKLLFTLVTPCPSVFAQANRWRRSKIHAQGPLAAEKPPAS